MASAVVVVGAVVVVVDGGTSRSSCSVVVVVVGLARAEIGLVWSVAILVAAPAVVADATVW